MDELFPKYCHMSPNCVIDESIIKCKPRLPYIIYCPFKPQRQGIQVFVHADSKNGYVQQYDIYLGSKLTPVSEKGLYFDVDKLTKPLQGLNAQVCFDNAYTSIPHLVHLQRKQKVFAAGTMRGQHLFLPQDINTPPKKLPRVITKHTRTQIIQTLHAQFGRM